MAVFILETHNPSGTNLPGQTFGVRLFTSCSIKTGTGRIMRLDGLSPLLRLGRRTSPGSFSRRLIRLVPVFILDKVNTRTANVCPSSSQTDYAYLV